MNNRKFILYGLSIAFLAAFGCKFPTQNIPSENYVMEGRDLLINPPKDPNEFELQDEAMALERWKHRSDFQSLIPGKPPGSDTH